MSDPGSNKRKSKSWYRKQAFRNKHQKTDDRPCHRLTPGLKGFIVTCNDRERDAVKESYNILNEYAEKLYGPEKAFEADEAGEDSDEIEDIEKALTKQAQVLKDASRMVDRRFQNSLTGAKNCIFIKTSLDDPAGLAQTIFSDLLNTKQQKSRYALRLLPVVGTCKANVKEINDLAKQVLVPFFTDTKFEVTYTINFKARNNNGLGRDMTISTLRNTVEDTFSSVLLRYTPVNPQITILVEVMCGVACIAVARDFTRFRKYNLVEVVNEKQVPAKESDGSRIETKPSETADNKTSQETANDSVQPEDLEKYLHTNTEGIVSCKKNDEDEDQGSIIEEPVATTVDTERNLVVESNRNNDKLQVCAEPVLQSIETVVAATEKSDEFKKNDAAESASFNQKTEMFQNSGAESSDG